MIVIVGGWLAAGASAAATTGQDVVSGATIEKALTRAVEGPAERVKTRGIRIEQSATEARAVVDLNIPFERDSSELQPQAATQLRELETALNSPALAKDRFLIAGHTDAQGDAEYNRQLSLRRAATVTQFLIAHGIAAERLQSAGEGETRLLTPDEPDSPANRRVEISNLGRQH